MSLVLFSNCLVSFFETFYFRFSSILLFLNFAGVYLSDGSIIGYLPLINHHDINDNVAIRGFLNASWVFVSFKSISAQINMMFAVSFRQIFYRKLLKSLILSTASLSVFINELRKGLHNSFISIV